MSISIPQNELFFSPLDGRYKKNIPPTLSEQSSLACQLAVEKAWLETLEEKGVFKPAQKLNSQEWDEVFSSVTQEKIDRIEERTQHATRALVEAIAEAFLEKGYKDYASWVHVGLTSFDTVDTAQRLRLKKYCEEACFPLLKGLLKVLDEKADQYAETLQLGRTHGQWAVPTYAGLAFAEAAERIRNLGAELRTEVSQLRGQASGAIGGYHASALLGEDPLALEDSFLEKLSLKAHFSSLQILPPEDMVSVAQKLYLIASVVAKVAHDLRHLARSEIAEIAEGLRPGQVGSSTMPQKRNPWNLEHICSLHKILLSKLNLLEMDVLTEHQRDLTNSASGRFYFEFFSVAHLMLHRFHEVLGRLEVNEENMLENLKKADSSVFAEAFYVLLSKEGVEKAHDKVREAARESERTDSSVLEVLQKQKLLSSELSLEVLKEKILKGSSLKFQKLKSLRRDV